MSHSTFRIREHQYRLAFRQLFPTRLLRRAVASRRRPTRQRQLPLYLLLSLLLTWFFRPEVDLPFLVDMQWPSHRRRPTDSAIYRARQRLGWQPLRWLRRQVLHLLACPHRDPYAFYQGRRLLALDGSTFTVADTPANARTFGRARNQHGPSGYPLARLVALCELGTHALIDWLVRGYSRGETELAQRLWRRVPAGTLLLADRNFHSFDLWQSAQDRRHDLLLRVQRGPKFPVLAVLCDGSYLSYVRPRRGKNKRARQIPVRVIVYQWRDEQGVLQQARLLTSLLDAVPHPATTLVPLYHQRWEHELVFKEIKQQLGARPMQIRAHDPLRVCQEVESLLLGHFTLRWAMLQAARQAGVPATTLSCLRCLRIVKTQLARLPKRPVRRRRAWRRWWEELVEKLGRQRLRPRKGRRCPRVRKVTRSHWPVKKGQKEGSIPQLEIVCPGAPAP